MRWSRGLLIALSFFLLSCGLVVSFSDYDTSSPGGNGRQYGVTGTVDGLEGATVTLLVNGGNSIDVVRDGAFTFPPSVLDGSNWAVAVKDNPQKHACTVVDGTGTISGGDGSGVTVHCPSTDATLQDLTLSSGVLSPKFDSGTLAYSAAVNATLLVTSITLTATTTSPGAHLTINSAPVTSGMPSAAIPVHIGPTAVDVTVTPADPASPPAHYAIAVVGNSISTYVKASNTLESAELGYVLALSADTLAVGAPFEASNATGVNCSPAPACQNDTSKTGSGAVYVFTRSGTTWSQQAYIKASNTSSNSQFGSSVALSGDTLVVGSPEESSNGTGVNCPSCQSDQSQPAAGAVYVFTRAGTTWSQQAYVKASNTGMGQNFGRAVGISGDTLIVGAPEEASSAIGVNCTPTPACQTDVSTNGSGAVYVFTRAGTMWSQQAYVKASTSHMNEVFGASTSIEGDTLVVGAPGDSSNSTGVNCTPAATCQNDTSGMSSGAVFVFGRVGTTWSQQAYIKASNTISFSLFGGSTALAGDTLAVGANNEPSNAVGVNCSPEPACQRDNTASAAGAVYVFARSGGTWAQQAYVKASNTRANAYFGGAVALFGDTLAVGSHYETSSATGINGSQADGVLANAGAAYVFKRNGTTWSQLAYVKALNTVAQENFGISVGVSADTLAAGATGDPSNATGINGDFTNASDFNAGAVTLY